MSIMQLLGVFVIQNETTVDITEAQQIFRQWNPSWKPSFFMTDFCQEEITAIETVFQGKTYCSLLQN